ncbi:MAG: hypothetical protein KatS3mg115_0375 [Candidatus Poribacteria bacterium]|nr:MAG: hypothetical protein KatS3mg115_0375 [Candidatus Poribacteria bacterium]
MSPRKGLFVRLWTRKLHFYVGLYFLFFLWLFALSGLSLNRPGWKWLAPEFRTESVPTERSIPHPLPENDRAAAQLVMETLGLRGELHQTERNLQTGTFKVWVHRPNRLYIATVEQKTGRVVELGERRTNLWGVLRDLHTFNGVSTEDRSQRRDWVFTTIWTLSMDALAVGIVFLVVSGLYLWIVRAGANRRWGIVALVAGTLLALWFLIGVPWLT